jgi:large subunit ribosomal protein L21
MFAVIKTGGKQYVVTEGQQLNIEKLDLEPGQTVEFETLLISNEDGSSCEIGAPVLSKSVKAEVVLNDRADKVSVIKFKRKVRYRRNVGHRQPFTRVKITKIA